MKFSKNHRQTLDTKESRLQPARQHKFFSFLASFYHKTVFLNFGPFEQDPRKRLWLIYGSMMAQLWLNDGSMMAQLWLNYGSVYGSTMAHLWLRLWLIYGSTMAQLWLNYGSFMAQIIKCC